MRIKSALYINLSDIADVIGCEYSDLCECFENSYTWGDTDVTLVNMQDVLDILDEEHRGTVVNATTNKNDPDLVSRLFVNLAD